MSMKQLREEIRDCLETLETLQHQIKHVQNLASEIHTKDKCELDELDELGLSCIHNLSKHKQPLIKLYGLLKNLKYVFSF